MATRKTGKTLEQIEKEQLEKEMKAVDTAFTNAQTDVNNYLADYNTSVDNEVTAVTDRYQQDIDNAGSRYQEQFDANAIAELVNQKKVEERMANMGLTDSGLNRTQQTALSVQKGNADAATRKSMQEYVDKLQILIDEAVAGGEAKKASEANKRNAALLEFKNELTRDAQEVAGTNAQVLYEAQENALDADYLAQLAAEQKKVEERNDEGDEEEVLPRTIGKIDSHKRAETVHEKNMHGNVSTAYIIVNEDCREYVKNGASRSQISTYLRKAYEAGKINKSQYDSLRKIYLPNGSGGRYAY